MTNPSISPSRFHGLPWESWTNSLGRTSPIEDKPPDSRQEKNKARVMKLPKEDMKIFGLCPEHDPVTVVVCATCNMCVKPQALLQHCETRHFNKETTTPQPPTVEITVAEKPAKPVKAIVKNPSTKVKTKKTSSKDSAKSKDGVVNPTPSLPVSLTLEGGVPLADPNAKGGGEVVGQVPAKPRSRPPRKHAPIKEREYDPDKHCGVVTAETMKPCTWSLTCKSHPMSLRRAVTGRSKPFDQLLADHRQAKETLLKQKKGALPSASVEPQLANSSVMLTPPSSQTSTCSELKSPRGTSHSHSHSQSWTGNTHTSLSITMVAKIPTKVVMRLPEISLDVTPNKRVYLSASPQSLVVKSSPVPLPPPPPPPLVPAPPVLTTPDLVPYSFNHPKALNVPMFANHKIGGLMYTNRRMHVARQNLENCLNRAGNRIYLAATQRRESYNSLHSAGAASSLSNVLNATSKVAQKSKSIKKNKSDKLNKASKKVCLTKEATSLLNIQLNSFKSVLSRQYTNPPNRLSVPSSTGSQFHLPNILSSALKRATESPPKPQTKKVKKSSVLSNQPTKNGLTPNKSNVPYVRVAIANGKVDTDSKTLGLCETPKFNNNKLLNESDLRKIGLRFEIYD